MASYLNQAHWRLPRRRYTLWVFTGGENNAPGGFCCRIEMAIRSCSINIDNPGSQVTSLLAGNHGLQLHSEADALDVLSSGLPACIFHEQDLHPDFFNLSNRLAGDLLQKFVNYHFPIAIVLPDAARHGERVVELVRDHRSHPCIRFFESDEAAESWLNTI